MSKLVIALGVVILLAGVSIGVFPDLFLGLTDWETQRGLYIAAGSRIVAGLILILAASASRYPVGLRIFGGLVLLAGFVLLFLPLDLWARLFGWVTLTQPALFRVGGGVGGTLLGLFLIHAAQPRRATVQGR